MISLMPLLLDDDYYSYFSYDDDCHILPPPPPPTSLLLGPRGVVQGGVASTVFRPATDRSPLLPGA